MKTQDTLAVAEAHPPVHLAPVALIAPLAALARVTVSGPARELVVENVVENLVVVFGDTVLVVVGPALDDWVERVNEARLRRTAMVLNSVP